jgi:hypothetical protein
MYIAQYIFSGGLGAPRAVPTAADPRAVMKFLRVGHAETAVSRMCTASVPAAVFCLFCVM